MGYTFRVRYGSGKRQQRLQDRFLMELCFRAYDNGAPEGLNGPARELNDVCSCHIADKPRADTFIQWLATLDGFSVDPDYRPVSWEMT